MFNVPVSIKESSIHGYGVFSTKLIQPNQTVWTYEPEKEEELVYSAEELNNFGIAELRAFYHLIWPNPLTGKFHVALGLDKFMNHSNNPNLKIILSRKTMIEVSKQTILPGAELTYDCRELGDYAGFFKTLRSWADLEPNELAKLVER